MSKRRRTTGGYSRSGNFYGRYNSERRANPASQYMRQYHPRSAETRSVYGRSWGTASAGQKSARRSHRVYGRGRYYSGRGRYYSGRGGYFKRFGRKMRHTGRMLGRQARRASHTLEAMAPVMELVPGIGPELSAGLHAAADGLDEVHQVGRQIRGSGSYTAPLVNSSEVLELGQRFGHPHFSAAAAQDADDGGLVISNQEFVANVYGNPIANPSASDTAHVPTQFESQVFTVNPGLAQTFPMLSQFAINFERYELIQCVFHYETALDSGVLQSDTGQVGDVLMYSHVDPTEPSFESVAEFMANGGSLTQVTKGLTVGVECDPTQLSGLPNAGLNYVRSGPLLDTDQAEADQATVQIAVADTPKALADHVLGKLYVSYTVKLVKPRLMSLAGANVMTDVYMAASHQKVPAVSNLLPIFADFGGLADHNRLPHSNIGGAIETVGDSTYHLKLTFPSWLNGTFRVRIRTANTDPPTAFDDEAIDHDTVSGVNGYKFMGTPMIVRPVVTGNVSLLPLGVEFADNIMQGSSMHGFEVSKHYDFGDSNSGSSSDSAHQETAGRSMDNNLTWSRHKNDGKYYYRFQGYAEFVLRISPATSNVDNTVTIMPAYNNPGWLAAENDGENAMFGGIMTIVNVETANNFGLSRTMKLHSWMQQLMTRNSDVMAYNV